MAASEALEQYWNVNIALRTRVRAAVPGDVDAVVGIVNEAIASRVAIDEYPKAHEDGARWFAGHDERYIMLVSVDESGTINGFGSLNRYQPEHDAHAGVATLWCFLASGAQRRGLGTILVDELERHARTHGFHKIVVRTFPANRGSRTLLRNFGYRVVGVFKRDAVIDGAYTDVMVLEKLLSPGHYRVGEPSAPEAAVKPSRPGAR